VEPVKSKADEKGGKDGKDGSARPERHRWHAVSILPTRTCREAVLLARNKRFLSGEAPRFPLPECRQPGRCECIYRHHEDRRAGPRRSTEKGWQPSPRSDPQGGEKRRSRGRRSTD
jgi:hypothetical protein